MCDGTHDCNDDNHSDECTPQCGSQEIINGTFLKFCTFLIGAAAVLVNIYMVAGIVRENRLLHSRAQFINLSLVLLISLGDFCVGVYLLNVFVVDQVYREKFCPAKYEWVTSGHCTLLGVLSTFGTQLSIFTMLCLSIYRVFTLKVMGGRARVTSQHKLYMCSISVSLVFLSLFIAVIPIMDYTEDYFTNGLYYKANTLFNKVANLDVHKDFINQYKMLSVDHKDDNSFPETRSYYSWRQVRKFMAEEVFSEDLVEVKGKSLKFYGNDGVCLFKYFVSPDDPQRIFSLTILSLNLVCFTIISATYISVIMTAQGSSNKTSTVKDSRSTQLQTKITLMVASNVLSWVPFGVICLLHTLDKIDATRYYKVSSIILLPVNSCVNPIIYSNILVDLFNWLKSKVRGENGLSVMEIKEQIEISFASSSARNLKKSLKRGGKSTDVDDKCEESNTATNGHQNPVALSMILETKT